MVSFNVVVGGGTYSDEDTRTGTVPALLAGLPGWSINRRVYSPGVLEVTRVCLRLSL